MSTTTKLQCTNADCQKPFAVISQEQEFYDAQKLPQPILCPACRHKQRLALCNERALYNRTCDKCQETMLSTYPDDAPYTVYCQACFWENIG